MKSQQIFNLFTYTGMMLIDNQILTTSPDYLREKTLRFFGTLGKSEYIDLPTPVYASQGILDRFFWTRYCDTWGVKKNDVELMNIINFLLNSNLIRTTSFNHMISPVDNRSVYKQFEKYIGDIETVPDYDLKSNVHFKIVEYLTKYIDFNDRFFKLKMLQYES